MRLVMEDFRLDLDRASYRVGDKAVLFGFFEDARHAREVVDRSDHDSRFDDDLSDLVAAARDFLQFTFCARRETHNGNLGKFRDR